MLRRSWSGAGSSASTREAHSVQEQIDHFAGAEVVVAPHGAALANLVFCRPGVRVLELFAPRYVNPCYWTIADNIAAARYRYLVCGRTARPGTHRCTACSTDIVVDPGALDARPRRGLLRRSDSGVAERSSDQLGVAAEPLDGALQPVLDRRRPGSSRASSRRA